MRKQVLVFVVLTFSLYSCVKPPTYSATPHIEFVSVSATTILNRFSDTISFSFTDGDGDIGVPGTNPRDTVTNCTGDSACAFQHGDSMCLHQAYFDVYLIDNRSNCIESFASANVQPTGKYKAISGNIQVIEGMYKVQPCPTNDTVFYSIILRDMAGHFSNIIQTTPIIITCQ